MRQSITAPKLLQISAVLFAFFIAISKPAATVAEVLAGVSWLWALRPQPRYAIIAALRHNAALHYCATIFGIYLCGIAYSSDLPNALIELQSKHYFISMPLFFGSQIGVFIKNKYQILQAFICGNAVAAAAIIYTYYSGAVWLAAKPNVPSPFMQRPRASIFIAFGLMCLLHQIFYNNNNKSFKNKLINISLFLLLIIGLVVLQGRIGQLGFLLMMLIWIFIYIKHRLNYLRTAVFLAFFAIFLVAIATKIPTIRQPFVQAISELQQANKNLAAIKVKDSSMGMRVVYYKIYADIAQQNPLFGVGTGDMERAATPYFNTKTSHYLPYDKPHNQFFEIFILFGAAGLLVFLYALMQLMRHVGNDYTALGVCFWFLILLSMCFDSTLGTQAGCSFVVFFAVFLVDNKLSKNTL